MFKLVSLTAFASVVNCREIVFPDVLPVQIPIASSFGRDESPLRFYGLTTFANIPYVECFAEDLLYTERYDIAILGAQFDTVGMCAFLCPLQHLYATCAPVIFLLSSFRLETSVYCYLEIYAVVFVQL